MDEDPYISVSDADEELLLQFLRGELDDDEFDELEQRLDEEPDLQKRLGLLARSHQEADMETGAVDQTTRFSGHGVVKRRHKPAHDRALEIGEVIGEGGMGVVYLGKQHSVGRDVAIKTVKSTEVPSISLLEEAWVTGQLEHPNIVPIHDIAEGEDGRAQVVLKHIEGQSWSRLVARPDEVRRRFNVDDPLEWHLRVLIQVCQALRFAHSRGIVHRDVKPANVMIGRFDEVYLLDWGLAISTLPSDRLPTLQTSYGIAGSPAYMAPEQFEAVPARVGPHTDVFLLGATLYELITGEPPHAGKTIDEIRERIAASDGPGVPEDAPAELGRIIERATSYAIERRYGSVQSMREAIEAFLQHRGSQTLADEAELRADAMRSLQKLRDDDGAERAFAEASFGYRMALRDWPGNEAARDALEALVRERVERLLELRAPSAAHRALAVLDNPIVDLAERVDAALEKEATDRQELRRLVRDEDRRIGYRERRIFVVALGAVWIAMWIYVGTSPPATPWPLTYATVGLFVPCTAAVLYYRHQMLAVRLNRYITLIICAMFAAQLLWLIGAAWLALPMTTVVGTLPLLWFLAVGSAVPTVEPRILPTAIAYGGGFLLAAYDPSLLPLALGGSSSAMVANMLYINIAISRQASRVSDPPPSTDRE